MERVNVPNLVATGSKTRVDDDDDDDDDDDENDDANFVAYSWLLSRRCPG